MEVISSEFASALIKARRSMDAVTKNKMNPAFKSKYAELCDILEEVVPPLLDNDILMTMPMTDEEEGYVGVRIELCYKSGERMASEPFRLKPSKSDPQGVLGATTYARRGLLTSFWCLPTEDDDGNTASGKTQNPVQSRQVTRTESKPAEPDMTPVQREAIEIKSRELGVELPNMHGWKDGDAKAYYLKLKKDAEAKK